MNDGSTAMIIALALVMWMVGYGCGHDAGKSPYNYKGGPMTITQVEYKIDSLLYQYEDNEKNVYITGIELKREKTLLSTGPSVKIIFKGR